MHKKILIYKKRKNFIDLEIVFFFVINILKKCLSYIQIKKLDIHFEIKKSFNNSCNKTAYH